MRVLVTFLFVLHLSTVELLIVRRYFQDGLLYEDFAADADHVRYTTSEGQGWDDLNALVAKEELRGKAMFCTRGPGSWLLYPEAKYTFGTGRQLKLINGEFCVPVDNVNSLQPLAALGNDLKGAVVHFPEAYFASPGKIHRKGEVSGQIKSVVFIGLGNWKVKAGDKDICVEVQGAAGVVCLVEDLQAGFDIEGSDVTITEKCDNGTKEVYQLQSCYSTGFHSITYEFDFTKASMKGICAASAHEPENQSQDKFLKVMKIWELRMGEDTFKFPEKIPNAPQRFSVLYLMFSILKHTCPSLDHQYLHILKHIFLLHLNHGRIWEGKENASTVFEQDKERWQYTHALVANCANKVGPDSAEVPNVPIPPVVTVPAAGPAVFQTQCGKPVDVSAMKSDMEADTIEDFLMGESYDFVIEQIWLILNYVSPYCNFMMGFRTNFWSNFPLLFKRDFLYPLQEQWKNPGKWATYYPLMFNGYNMEDQWKSLISCVQSVILTTPFYDPLARPPAFYRDTLKNATWVGSTGTDSKPPGKRQVKYEDDSLNDIIIGSARRIPAAPRESVSEATLELSSPTPLTATRMEPAVTEELLEVIQSSTAGPEHNRGKHGHGKKRKSKHSKKGGKRRGKGVKKVELKDITAAVNNA